VYKREQLFWNYLVERESIRLRRLNGSTPWTNDQIFKEYSFTNVKREHDRTTMLLVREFYSDHLSTHPSSVALLNATLFRYFGTIEAARVIGWHDEWNEDIGHKMRRAVEVKMAFGHKMYTGAYIVPAAGMSESKAEVVRIVANQIWENANHILDTDSWQTACDRMTKLWAVGQFMAKEVLLDYILITGWTPCDWHTWTPIGPGARRGAAVVVHDRIRPGVSVDEALEVCEQLYSHREEYWPADYVLLDLTDIQFALCELAKYRKVQTGEGRPRKKFRPTVDDITKRVS